MGKKAVFSHKMAPKPSEFHLRHELHTHKARSSPTCFAEKMARRKVDFDSHFNSAPSRGSKGGEHTVVPPAPRANPMLESSGFVGFKVSGPLSERGSPACGIQMYYCQLKHVEMK